MSNSFIHGHTAHTSAWPKKLFIIRHGQSAGNVAREAAEAAGHGVIDQQIRDMDVPLSELGRNQASAVGQWLSQHENSQADLVFLCSPYERARETTSLIRNELQVESGASMIFDERLREREFGGIEGLTRKGIIERFPREAEMYDSLGKFYYRPPGGESWCDVILRLRSLLDTLAREFSDKRVVLVCHSVVVLCLRYLLEQMSEVEILKIDRENLVANCSLTTYVKNLESKKPIPLEINTFNFVAPVEEAGEKITRAQDRPKS